jgi:hypothetical protein
VGRREIRVETSLLSVLTPGLNPPSAPLTQVPSQTAVTDD